MASFWQQDGPWARSASVVELECLRWAQATLIRLSVRDGHRALLAYVTLEVRFYYAFWDVVAAFGAGRAICRLKAAAIGGAREAHRVCCSVGEHNLSSWTSLAVAGLGSSRDIIERARWARVKRGLLRKSASGTQCAPRLFCVRLVVVVAWERTGIPIPSFAPICVCSVPLQPSIVLVERIRNPPTYLRRHVSALIEKQQNVGFGMQELKSHRLFRGCFYG